MNRNHESNGSDMTLTRPQEDRLTTDLPAAQ